MKASVIIPSYNACERLYYNLLSLSQQSYPKEQYEVVIIDNGSTDKTWSMLDEFKASINITKLRLTQNGNRSYARNKGILSSTGELIIFSDSDMISESTFIEAHIKEHRDSNRVVCGCNWDKIYTYYYKEFSGYLERNLKCLEALYELEAPLHKLGDKSKLIDKASILDNSYKRYIFTNSIYQCKYDKTVSKYGENLIGYSFPWSFFITNNCSVNKADILQAGMFDEGYHGWGCEDLDLGYRLYKNGCSFAKKEINSAHQEHPIKAWDNGIKNIYSFSEKYDAIDILLFYFYSYSPIESDSVNDIAAEIKILEEKNMYRLLCKLFKDMLKLIRDKNFRQYTDNRGYTCLFRETRDYIVNNIGFVREQCLEAKDFLKSFYFVKAFVLLAKYLFKLDVLPS